MRGLARGFMIMAEQAGSSFVAKEAPKKSVSVECSVAKILFRCNLHTCTCGGACAHTHTNTHVHTGGHAHAHTEVHAAQDTCNLHTFRCARTHRHTHTHTHTDPPLTAVGTPGLPCDEPFVETICIRPLHVCGLSSCYRGSPWLCSRSPA